MSFFSKLIRIVLLAGLIVLSAKISFEIPLSEGNIPITAQSLAVMVICIFLEPWEALLVTALYLGIGALGVPVYADGGSGVEKLTGNSGGFLYGFVVTGVFISFLGKKNYYNSFVKSLIAMSLATVLLLLIGNVHLAALLGIEKALDYGLYPFWKAALVKVFLGALLITFIRIRFLANSRRSIKIQ